MELPRQVRLRKMKLDISESSQKKHSSGGASAKSAQQNRFQRGPLSCPKLFPFRLLGSLFVLIYFSVIPSVVQGQFDDLRFGDDFQSGNLFSGGTQNSKTVLFSAHFQQAEESKQGRLTLSAEIQDTWHIYSITQKPGGPTPTTIKIEGSGAKPSGPFRSLQEPIHHTYDHWKGLDVEEHEGKISWQAPLIFADGANPPATKLKVTIAGLACTSQGACVPFQETISVPFTGTYPAPKTENVFRDPDSIVDWKITLTTAAKAGEVTELKFTATPDNSYHLYAAAVDDKPASTNFVLIRKGPFKFGMPTPSTKPVTEKVVTGGKQSFHEGKITWTVPITTPKNAVTGAYPIEGFVVYQTCNDSSCYPALALRFSGVLNVADQADATRQPLKVSIAETAKALDAAATQKWQKSESVPAPIDSSIFSSLQAGQLSFLWILLLGIASGLILNLMPCVLPVLGLKILALTDQAGQDSKEIFRSNIWYTAGIMTVFWLLAAGVSTFSFGWGEQFTYLEFRFTLMILIFAFALSFLGVWEIPVPGIAGGQVSQTLQQREGPLGAFSKGVFTTLLATPCSGPLLGSILGLLIGKPPSIVFAVFTAVGLGMAAPFLAIAVNPRLVSWLPKPGAWMETFKQLMAFPLLGAVAFFFATLSDTHKVPAFITLIGVWFGCWIIGQVPGWADLHKRVAAWLAGIASAAAIAIIAFQMLLPGKEILPWQPYDEAKLAQFQREGKTVLIDFTAKWCVNCHSNYLLAINTEKTAKRVHELDVVVMLADWTDRGPNIKNKLRELESNSIPLLAIYPGNNPNRPIVLRDLISQQQLLDALERAGPSVSPHDASAVAQRRHIVETSH